MADASQSKSKTVGKSATKDAGAATASAGGKPKKRRLGRGLGSLLAIPVDVDSGEPRSSGESKGIRGDQATGSPSRGRLATLAVPTGPGGIALPGNDPPRGISEHDGEDVSVQAQDKVQVRLIEVSMIQPNQHQPRVDFDEGSLNELAGSIERSGLMQPIVVRSTGNTGAGKASGALWEVIAGERRLRAIKSLNRTHVPAVVIEVGEREAAELALIENLQREDLNPIERAQALARLQESFGLTQKEVAERVGLDRSTIANLIRILELDDFSIAALRRGSLTLGHAKALLAISDQQLRRATAAATLNGGWSVRDLERRVRRLLKPVTEGKAGEEQRPITARRANVVDLERRLGEILGMRVQITLGRKKGSGKLQVSFDSLDQFDRLTELLGLSSRDAS